GCTGEMKELAAAALYSVEEALKSPNTSQKNMKITYEEVMKISNFENIFAPPILLMIVFMPGSIVVPEMHRRNEGISSSSSLSNAFQKNMKTTCEEVVKISDHFLKSSQKLSSHLKNQEHYTNVTSSRPIKPQSEWINLMHGDQSPKTWNFQQQKKQLKPCETYKQSYNAKLKYALDNQPKITTGQTKEKMFEFKTKKPEESS
ncbi:hypothetical protein Tco_0109131, partial [Tanacetum coccineum]